MRQHRHQDEGRENCCDYAHQQPPRTTSPLALQRASLLHTAFRQASSGYLRIGTGEYDGLRYSCTQSCLPWIARARAQRCRKSSTGRPAKTARGCRQRRPGPESDSHDRKTASAPRVRCALPLGFLPQQPSRATEPFSQEEPKGQVLGGRNLESEPGPARPKEARIPRPWNPRPSRCRSSVAAVAERRPSARDLETWTQRTAPCTGLVARSRQAASSRRLRVLVQEASFFAKLQSETLVSAA